MRKLTATKYTSALCGLALLGSHLALHAATLTNRYNFNEAAGTTAADSVGGLNATLMNAAAFTGSGQAAINSFGLNSTDPSGDYISLPDNIVSNRTAITVETWYTPTHNGAAFADWNRIWDFWNATGHFFLRSGNATFGIGGDITTTSSSQGMFGPTVVGGVESHVVWSSDPSTGIGKLYINGVSVLTVTGFTNTPAGVGATTNNWLGRAKFPDPYLQATYNEFRIYSGALNPLEIAASYQSGADAPSDNFGTVTSLTLTAPSSLQLGNSQQVQVTAAASGLTNQNVNINGQPGLTYSSSAPGVVAVSSGGNLTAAGLGTATVTATYVVNSVTNTASQLVSVISVPARLMHRYSFTNDASSTADDSIGSAHGTLQGSASQSGGAVSLDGLGGTYVSLPSNMVSTATISNGAVTLETWASFGVNPNWVNLFAFGNSVVNDGGNYLFFSPHTGAGDHRVVVSSTMPGWSGAGEQWATGPGTLDNQTNVHIACVVNFGRDLEAVYINGARVGQNTAFTRELTDIINNFSQLGKSTYALDPYLNASIDEFRIYDGALSAQQIAASAQTTGPGSTNINPGTFVNLSLSAPASLPQGWQSTELAVLANWQFATNVNLVGDLDLVFSSSNTNVATISGLGVITALNLGTTTLSATYQGNTSTQLLTVVNPTSTLLHRYSFNETSGDIVPDLVGTAHGSIAVTNAAGLTNAVWTGAGLVINTNTSLGSQDAFVDLPDGTISALTNNATFEVWLTAYSGDFWARILDVGSAPGSPNFFLGRGGTFDWWGGSVPHGGFASGAQTHIVVAYNDAQNQCKVFVNGVQTAISGAGAAGTAVSSLPDTNIWLGRSLYVADPFLQAEFDEFRIYSGLLTSDQVMQSFLVGPNLVIPTLSFSASGGNLNLLWPTNATGYALMSSPLLGTGASWTAVGGSPSVSGTNYLLTVPSSPGMKYFRLQK